MVIRRATHVSELGASMIENGATSKCFEAYKTVSDYYTEMLSSQEFGGNFLSKVFTALKAYDYFCLAAELAYIM